MPQVQQKPIIHGRDHMAGGADPIPGMGSGGLAFDTYPQDGGWFYMRTTDETEAGGSPHGSGIEIKDTSSGGIWIHTFDAIALEAATVIGLEAHTDRIVINSDATGLAGNAVEITAPTGAIGIGGDSVALQSQGAAAFLQMSAGGGIDLSGSDIALIFSANIRLITLPTSDPGIPGALWNDTTTVRVSP